MQIQSDQNVLEKIAQFIESLPSQTLWNYNLTQDQENWWKQNKFDNHLLAQAWREQHRLSTADKINTIEQYLLKQEISKNKYDLLWVTIDEYRKRWELIQVAEPFVKHFYTSLQKSQLNPQYSLPLSRFFQKIVLGKLFNQILSKDYCFNSSYDLFIETVKEQRDQNFADCLKSYYEVKFKKWRKGVKQFIGLLDKTDQKGKYLPLSLREQNQLKQNLDWHNTQGFWLSIVLLTCQIQGMQFWKPTDPELKQCFLKYNQTLIKALRCTFTMSRKVQGYAWNKGQQILSSPQGGVYRDS